MKRVAMMVALSVVASTAALTLGCDGGASECTVPDGLEPGWVRKVGCEADYSLLWSERDDAIFASTRTIIWLIDRDQNYRFYFINTDEFELHYFFANSLLNLPGTTPVGTHADFNILNYRRENRRFVLGKLIHYLDQELLTIEFSAGDTASASMIIDAHGRVADAIFDGNRLLYRAVSASQEAMLAEISAAIPTIATEEVFRGQTYQPLHTTVGYGTLRFRRIAELAGQPLGPTDIAVLDRVPTDLAMTSGVITDEFQTPLSHVNILSKNRGTPNMGLRGAFSDEGLRALEGELVKLEVTAQAYSVVPATLAEAESFWTDLRPTEVLIPQLDSSVVGLVSLADVGASASNSIGAKAANLAELAHIGLAGVALPVSPLALPFSAYESHLGASGLDAVAAEIIDDVALGNVTADELATRLFDLRWRIFKAPLDSTFRDELVVELTARFGGSAALRFRSSTNAEDLPEFSGAGLYTSAGGNLSEGPAAIEDAVKAVWSSVWNLQAFVERDFYRVDHSRVRMGVLVHPAFQSEQANGVAVTINEFAENRPAYYINSQAGEISVTNPTGLAIPEQILYYTWYEEPEYEVITRSSLLDGGSVLSPSELTVLADALEAIHNHFRVLSTGGTGFAMDVEFKFDSSRNLVIKQARPLKRR